MAAVKVDSSGTRPNHPADSHKPSKASAASGAVSAPRADAWGDERPKPFRVSLDRKGQPTIKQLGGLPEPEQGPANRVYVVSGALAQSFYKLRPAEFDAVDTVASDYVEPTDNVPGLEQEATADEIAVRLQHMLKKNYELVVANDLRTAEFRQILQDPRAVGVIEAGHSHPADEDDHSWLVFMDEQGRKRGFGLDHDFLKDFHTGPNLKFIISDACKAGDEATREYYEKALKLLPKGGKEGVAWIGGQGNQENPDIARRWADPDGPIADAIETLPRIK